MFLSCVFINFIFVFLTFGQDYNSGMQKRIHFRTDMEHNICRPVNNSDVSLRYQFCKNITFILYMIYNVRYNKYYWPSVFTFLFITFLLHLMDHTDRSRWYTCVSLLYHILHYFSTKLYFIYWQSV